MKNPAIKSIICLITLSIFLVPNLSSAETKVIKVISWYLSQQLALYDDLFKQFEKDHPGVKIEAKALNKSSYDRKLKNSFLSGEPYDIFALEPDGGSRGMVQFIASDKLLDLSEWYEKYGWNKTFYKNLVEQATFNGKKYSVPASANNLSLMYNKTTLDKYNLKLPTTYEELKSVCEVVVSHDLYCYGLAGNQANLVRDFFAEIAGQISGNLIRDLDTGKVKFTDPLGIKVFTYIKKMVDDKILSVTTLGFSTDVIEPIFWSGKALFYQTGPWTIKSTKTNAPKGQEFGVIQLPLLEKGFQQRSPGGISTNFSVYKNAKHKELISELLNYITNLKNQEAVPLIMETGLAVRPLANNKKTIKDPILQSFSEFQKNISVRVLLSTELAGALTSAVQGVIDGSMDIEEAAESVEEARDF